MPLSANLMKDLKKGSFPLLDQYVGIPLWQELVAALEKDFNGTIKEIFGAAPKNSGNFPGEVAVGKGKNKRKFDQFDDSADAHQGPRLLGNAHARLTREFQNVRVSSIADLITRVRALMEKHGFKRSKVHLIKSSDTNMGGGMSLSEVSALPDTSVTAASGFGSTPSVSINTSSPCWAALRRRNLVNNDAAKSLGKGTHYILGHMLNHNLNGPGDDVTNLVPLAQEGNKLMAKAAEGFVKDLAQHGVLVKYSITLGPLWSADPTYKAWNQKTHAALDPKTAAVERSILEWELKLPQYLTISATADDRSGVSQIIVPAATTIPNFVPKTIPVLT